MSKQILSVAELAKAWRVAGSTIRGWIADGELVAFNVNQHGKRPKWRIRIEDAEAFRKARSNAQRAKRTRRRKTKLTQADLEQFV